MSVYLLIHIHGSLPKTALLAAPGPAQWTNYFNIVRNLVTDSDVEVFDIDNKEFSYNEDDKTVQINTNIMSMDLARMGTT